MTTNLQAVIWDFGGVLTSSPFEAFTRYEVDNGLPKDFVRSVNAVNIQENAWAKLERSEVSADEFDDLFRNESRRSGTRFPERIYWDFCPVVSAPQSLKP
jgi:putative hydrolase of the HAD superfamily